MLRDQLEQSGTFLFRWRSYLPLVMVPVLAAGMGQFHYPYESHRLDMVWEGVCLAIAAAGELVRVLTVGFVPKGTSGRNTKTIKAAQLNTSGIYSIVRHPLYLGNFLIFMAMMVFVRLWWVALAGALLYWLYYERIMLAEEAFLERTYGEAFKQWAARTPAIIPRLSLWKAPELRFSLRTALRREHTTVFMIVCVFTALEIAAEFEVRGVIQLEPMWAAIFVSGLVFYLVVHALKKLTHVLEVSGR